MTGYCYAMVSGETVKIGWSSAPALRVNKVRSDTPADVRLVGFVESTVDQEREIHGLLAPFRVFGEWFRMEGAVVAFVDALRGRGMPKIKPPSLMTPQMTLQEFMEAQELKDHDVARSLSVDRSTVNKLRQRKSTPSFDVACKISVLSGGRISLADMAPITCAPPVAS